MEGKGGGGRGGNLREEKRETETLRFQFFLNSCFFHPSHALANKDTHPSFSPSAPLLQKGKGTYLLAFSQTICNPFPSRKHSTWHSPCENFLPTNSILFSPDQQRMLGFKREQCYSRDHLKQAFKTGMVRNKATSATITQSDS